MPIVLPETPTGLFSAIVYVVLGLVVTFSGFRLARGLAGLAGFLMGAAAGLLLGTLVAGPIGGLVGLVVGGVVLAILAVMTFRLLAAVLAGAVAWAAALALGWPIWAVILVAVVAGVIGLVANKLVLIVATSAVGAALLVTGAIYLLQRANVNVGDPPTTFLVGALVFTLLGIASQWRKLRDEP